MLPRFKWLLCTGVLSLSTGCTSPACIFDAASLKQEIKIEQHATSYKWLGNNSVVGKLDKVDHFSLQQWSCNHFSRQLVLTVNQNLSDEQVNDTVLKAIAWAIPLEIQSTLSSELTQTPIKTNQLPYLRQIKSIEFDELYIKAGKSEGLTRIEIQFVKS